MIVHSTQSFNIDLKQTEPECSASTCVFTIAATPTTEFCNATGGVTESIEVKVNVGLKEEARIKYYVACACECSQKVERNSPFCNRKGNLTCGACTCEPGWYVPQIILVSRICYMRYTPQTVFKVQNQK